MTGSRPEAWPAPRRSRGGVPRSCARGRGGVSTQPTGVAQSVESLGALSRPWQRNNEGAPGRRLHVESKLERARARTSRAYLTTSLTAARRPGPRRLAVSSAATSLARRVGSPPRLPSSHGSGRGSSRKLTCGASGGRRQVQDRAVSDTRPTARDAGARTCERLARTRHAFRRTTRRMSSSGRQESGARALSHLHLVSVRDERRVTRLPFATVLQGESGSIWAAQGAARAALRGARRQRLAFVEQRATCPQSWARVGSAQCR